MMMTMMMMVTMTMMTVMMVMTMMMMMNEDLRMSCSEVAPCPCLLDGLPVQEERTPWLSG